MEGVFEQETRSGQIFSRLDGVCNWIFFCFSPLFERLPPGFAGLYRLSSACIYSTLYSLREHIFFLSPISLTLHVTHPPSYCSFLIYRSNIQRASCSLHTYNLRLYIRHPVFCFLCLQRTNNNVTLMHLYITGLYIVDVVSCTPRCTYLLMVVNIY